MFAIGFFAALVYVLHGKPLADWLFNEGESALTAGFHNGRVYLTLAAVVFLFTSLRLVDWSERTKFVAGAAGAVAGPLGAQFQSTSPSALIFVLHIYLCVVALAIVAVEPIFVRPLDPEFWRRFVAPATKAVGYLFTLFSAVLAVLQYVSKGLNESIPGYVTSLAYPVGALVLSLAMVVYWLLAPAWQKYISTFLRDVA